MIWFASLDPANFSLNLDLSGFTGKDQSERSTMSAILNSCIGDMKSFLYNLNKIEDTSEKTRCIFLSSIIWHEQRHFLDLILTNYGGYIFRQFETCYANTSQLINHFCHSKKSKTISFPLSLYIDDVRRTIGGEERLPEGLNSFINEITAREKAISLERKHFGDIKGIGGYAQLEVLGTIYQTAAIEVISPNYADQVRKLQIKSDPSNQKYSWPLRYNHILKLPKVKWAEGIVQVGCLPILLYACLNNRSWSKDISDGKKFSLPKDKFLSPAERFDVFLEYLDGRKSVFEPNNFEEVWGKINKISSNLFGRTISEEIEVNIEFQEKSRKKYKGKIDEQTEEFINQHLELRKTFYKIFKNNPKTILHTEEYCYKLIDKVLPVPVLNFPKAIPESQLNLNNWEELHGLFANNQNEKPTKLIWSAIPKNWNKKDAFTFPITLNWKRLVTAQTPLAKAILKGRNHRTMLGPEFITMEEELKNIGLTIKYESDFEFPNKLVYPSDLYYELYNTDNAICDTCGKKTKSPEGYLISPWAFRQNSNIKKIMINALGGGLEGEIKFLIDWAPWFVCSGCRDSLIENNLIKQ